MSITSGSDSTRGVGELDGILGRLRREIADLAVELADLEGLMRPGWPEWAEKVAADRAALLDGLAYMAGRRPAFLVPTLGRTERPS